MIITLKGANFSGNYIGTLTTYIISVSGAGLTHSIPSTIQREGATLTNQIITINDGYELNGDVVVKMGGTTLSGVATVDGNTITINIGSVTGNVSISVPTKSTSGEDEPTPDVPPATGETVTFTLDTATTASTTEMVHTVQSIGSAVAYQEAGTRGVVTWDIPAYAIVTLTVGTGGSYGMALTDRNDIVLASTATSAATDGTITFPIQTIPTRVHASKAKFTSGSYTTYSEEELKGMELSVSFTGAVTGQYVSINQTVGSPIVLSDLSSGSYNISNTIPANTQVTITCKETTAGNYGMALCDTSGNIIEYINHTDTASTDNKHTFTTQTVETKLYVSVNKFDSAVYTIV